MSRLCSSQTRAPFGSSRVESASWLGSIRAGQNMGKSARAEGLLPASPAVTCTAECTVPHTATSAPLALEGQRDRICASAITIAVIAESECGGREGGEGGRLRVSDKNMSDRKKKTNTT